MPTTYIVAQGDSMSSIGFAYGFHPDAIWNHPANADLRTLRTDPNVLFVGDVVTIPDKQVTTYNRPTTQRHTFTRKGVPATLRLQFYADEKPRANEPYELEIDGRLLLSARTDGDGLIKASVPPNARRARVLFHDGAEVHEIALGHLDPIDEVSGVQGRLHNLGFFFDAVDGTIAETTVAALKAFQARAKLEPTGTIDDATRAALLRASGG